MSGGVFLADLCLADTEDILFVAVVDFDFPSPEVELNDFLEGPGGVRANEVSGLAVEDFTVFAQPVAQGLYDDEAQDLLPG